MPSNILPLQLPEWKQQPMVSFANLGAGIAAGMARNREDADRERESAAFGGLVDAAQGTTPPAPQEQPQLPRGLRNNNPGNIEDGPLAKSLPGYKGREPPGPYGEGRFAVFDSPENGLNAMDALLTSYGRRGLKTALDVTTRWAPKNAKDPNNDPEAYARYIGGGDPNKVIDYSNPEERKRIVQAMARWENRGQLPGMGQPQSAGGMPPELQRKVQALFEVGTPGARKAAMDLVTRFMPGGDAEFQRAQIENMREQRSLERDKLNMPVVVGNANTGYYLVDRNGRRIVAGGDTPAGAPPAGPVPTAEVGPDGQPAPVQPASQPAGQPVPRPAGATPIVPGKTPPPPGSKIDPGLSLKSDQKALIRMAAQARSGDTSVKVGLGRGNQGAENLILLQNEMARQDREPPKDDEEEGLRTHGVEQSIKNAEYFGLKAGQRTLGTRVANIELAATEFLKVAPIVEQASAAVSRTQYPDINKLINAYKEKTGDPAVVRLGGAINTAVNVYARAIAPQGAGTVSDKDHARELLQRAYANGQITGQIQLMKQEIDAALEAPSEVRDAWRKRFREGQGRSVLDKDKPATGGGTAPAPLPPPPEAVRELRANKDNPTYRASFDKHFGAGAADRVLGPAR